VRVIFAFIRSTFHLTYIYRLDFWARLVAVCIMMYATYSLWSILYQQNPNAFGMTRAQMTTYGVLGMLLSPILDSASFVQFYIGEQVREGTLELDLLKPLHFIFHMFSRHLGIFVVTLLFQGLPAFVVAALFLDFRLPESPNLTLAFALSLFLGYLINFAISLLIGMLSVVTLKIDSYAWAYFSLERFASGQIVPLWMFPPALLAFVSVLPFKDVYFVPMSIYIGAAEGQVGQLILSQAAWAAGLYAGVLLFWMRVQRRITVQGG
jgi:ABC-2 type transport system permease protein